MVLESVWRGQTLGKRLLKISKTGAVYRLIGSVFDRVFAVADNVVHHLAFVIGFSLALDGFDRPLRAGADARTESIAEQVANQTRLFVDDLQRPLGAIRNAIATAIALV